MKKYQRSKKECEAGINKDYVCERCGRTPIAMKTVDNAGNPTFWSGCLHKDKIGKETEKCGHFTVGVPKYIFEIAEKLVCQEGAYYSHTRKSDYANSPEERLLWFQNETAGWASLLETIEYLKNNPPRRTKQETLEDKYF